MGRQGAVTLFAGFLAQRVQHADDVKVHDALAVDIAGRAHRAAINNLQQPFI